MTRHEDRRDKAFIGALLVGVGLFVLIGTLLRSEIVGLLILPLLGLAFLGYGFYKHEFGFTIPGSILTGLGAALLLVVYVPALAGPAAGGVFMIGLALGFVAIAFISLYFERKVAWWPLVPGGIIGAVGVLLMFGTAEAISVLQVMGLLWPLVLIIVGAYILIVPGQRKN